jgi:hypothetical protein
MDYFQDVFLKDLIFGDPGDIFFLSFSLANISEIFVLYKPLFISKLFELSSYRYLRLLFNVLSTWGFPKIKLIYELVN